MFITKLKSLMKERKVTNRQLSLDIGIGINQVKYWEKNGNIPNGDVLKKIAEYFGVTVSDLIEEKKPVVKSERLEKFIRLFESLTPEQQATFISQMEWIADKKD